MNFEQNRWKEGNRTFKDQIAPWKRIDRYVVFAEVKPEYKKDVDSVNTHEDLLRLPLFGMNALEEHDSKCILLLQVLGKVKRDANSGLLL
ncbi:hypothetical protein MBANPS3_008036 [Mucor bainieri]